MEFILRNPAVLFEYLVLKASKSAYWVLSCYCAMARSVRKKRRKPNGVHPCPRGGGGGGLLGWGGGGGGGMGGKKKKHHIFPPVLPPPPPPPPRPPSANAPPWGNRVWRAMKCKQIPRVFSHQSRTRVHKHIRLVSCRSTTLTKSKCYLRDRANIYRD